MMKVVKDPVINSAPIMNSHDAVSVKNTSNNQLADDIPADVRQAIIATLEAEGQAFVVQAEEMQDRGLQVVDVDFVAGDGEA